MQNISKHITYKEATRTDTGYQNVPDINALNCMYALADKVLEPVRNHFNSPLVINSFYRSHKVNNAVGGSITSQHTLGQAADICGSGEVTNKMIFDYIKSNLEYDQLIWEFGTDDNPKWVHVSYRKAYNRKQVLRSLIKKGKVIYVPY